jgi:hypothetical protein
MKTLMLIFMCCLALGTYADDQTPSTGDRVKSDAKGLGSSVVKATKNVGKQIGAGTRKTVTSIKTKVKTDVKQGAPGDGGAKSQNEKMDTAKAGRK